MTRAIRTPAAWPQRREHFLVALAALLVSLAAFDTALAQDPATPTFRASVAVVPITAVVRDARNRVITSLQRQDFEVLEHGTPRPIVDFMANADGPVSIAFLFDTSGSMAIASNLNRGREVVAQLLYRMQPTRDEAALFTFHRSLHEEVPFTNDMHRVGRALQRVKPWGLTSIYDAVAETAKRLMGRSAVRRAVVVITDGVDTSSELTPGEVASLASAIDVPVYVVAVVSPLDHTANDSAMAPARVEGGLRDLADTTGGDVVYVSAADMAATLAGLVTTMRHQYFVAIESSNAPGWYSLEVRTRKKGLTVRARRAYFSQPPNNPARQ